MSFDRILLASLAINLLWVIKTEASYSRLNSYLTQNVPDDNVDTNMDAAIRWLKELETSKPPFFIKNPIKNLKRFVALKQVIDDTKCNDEAYEIMRVNDEAVGLLKLNDNQKVVRRVDKVIMKIFKGHAMKCSKVYPTIWRSRMEQFDKQTYKHVENLSTIVMNADKFVMTSKNMNFVGTTNDLYIRYIKNNPTIQAFARENILYAVLIANSQGDFTTAASIGDADQLQKKAQNQPILTKIKVKSLIKQYVIEPCQQYISKFGRDLFTPARFDARVFNEIDEKNRDYYLGWTYFSICRSVSDEEAMFYNLIDSSMNYQR